MESSSEAAPNVGDELTKQPIELQSTRNRVMLSRPELAADPLHYRLTATGARRSAKYDRTPALLTGDR